MPIHRIIEAVSLILIICLVAVVNGQRYYSKERRLELREKVRGMFQHAYDGYLNYAKDYDELRPLTCDGVNTWGSYSLTLVDALDTLATMGNYTEFRRVAQLLETKMNFDRDINVSVFETNIRILGGLLSAHLLSQRAGLQTPDGWPCQGGLLRLAEDVARRLLPAFDTSTGMPYGTVNLRFGVPKGETSITCTAGVGTFLIEFGTLSRLTGNPVYEEVALNAIHALWERRSPLGLFGNHIDVQTGRWTALDAGIGAGVDSFFEYLVKGGILLNRPELLEMFHEARRSIDAYLKRDDWYVWASMTKGQVTLPVFQSLEAFWPGVLSLVGDTGPAVRTLARYLSVWRKYGFLPEFFNIPLGEASVNRESYPLRPELAESLMYLHRATGNQLMLESGEQMLESIEFSARTRCGYATIRNVLTHEKENRMESFFLAETTKYLYLLFDEDNFLHDDGAAGDLWHTAPSTASAGGVCVINAGAHIFNTEAHPIDMSALECCRSHQQQGIYDGIDLAAFSDEALLRGERERRQRAAEVQTKYQCGGAGHEVAAPPMQSKQGATAADGKAAAISVDIEVFDDDDQPADAMLIESFQRIRQEKQSGSEGSPQSAEADKALADSTRNQLTVTDLDEFFARRRHSFPAGQDSPTAILRHVVAFMRNFTLDANFISGLQVLDKNHSAVLGAVVQMEYEGQMRTLWQLYDLQAQYDANARVIVALGLHTFEEGARAQLERAASALNRSEPEEEAVAVAAVDANNDDADALLLANIKGEMHGARLRYEQVLVNTTAMQEFLLRILRNGTLDKTRTYEPLLTAQEVDGLVAEVGATTTTASPALTNRALFAHARRVVELKQRMIDAFDRLQALIDESGKQTTTTTANGTATDALKNNSKSATSNNNTGGGGGSQSLIDNTRQPKVEPVKHHQTGDGDKPETESVWSQLVQTILRKTNIQRTVKFDVDELQAKTRVSLAKYLASSSSNNNNNHKAIGRYELFTCARPKFIERFAHRDFYP